MTINEKRLRTEIDSLHERLTSGKFKKYHKDKIILYSDINKSTYISFKNKSALGVPYMTFIGFHHIVVESIVEPLKKHGKALIGNKWGDGVVCFFDTTNDAIRSAFLILNTIDANTEYLAQKVLDPMRLSFAIHKGEYYELDEGWARCDKNATVTGKKRGNSKVAIRSKEYVGCEISLTQRIQSLAKPSSVLITDEAIKPTLRSDSKIFTYSCGSKSGDMYIFEELITWNDFVHLIFGKKYRLKRNSEFMINARAAKLFNKIYQIIPRSEYLLYFIFSRCKGLPKTYTSISKKLKKEKVRFSKKEVIYAIENIRKRMAGDYEK